MRPVKTPSPDAYIEIAPLKTRCHKADVERAQDNTSLSFFSFTWLSRQNMPCRLTDKSINNFRRDTLYSRTDRSKYQ